MVKTVMVRALPEDRDWLAERAKRHGKTSAETLRIIIWNLRAVEEHMEKEEIIEDVHTPSGPD